MRPEIGEQRKAEVLPISPRALGVRGVYRHRQQFDVRAGCLGKIVAQRAQFTAAHAAEREWVEDQHDVLLAAEIGQLDGATVLILQFEVGGLLADVHRHVRVLSAESELPCRGVSRGAGGFPGQALPARRGRCVLDLPTCTATSPGIWGSPPGGLFPRADVVVSQFATDRTCCRTFTPRSPCTGTRAAA